MKKVLVVYYSQSGQLTDAVMSMTAPLVESPDVSVCYENIRPEKPYPFPWPFIEFFSIFPECVYLEGPGIHPLAVDENEAFDLVILAYQVWFLSPALPMLGFLQSASGRKLLKDRPVITFITCRNLWLLAQEEMKKILWTLDARLLDNVALTDRNTTWSTYITTPVWLMTGRKKRLWGFMPPPGLAPEDISQASRFGRVLVEALARNLEKMDRPLLAGLRAVQVDDKQIPREEIARRIFLFWGKLLKMAGPQGSRGRHLATGVFVTFFLPFVALLLPVSYLLRRMLSPLIRRKFQEMKEYFEQPSGSADHHVNSKGV